jgi:hypothetical protein
MKGINMYRLKIDENTMHNIIRYDHGVHQVFHEIALDSRLPWFNVTDISPNDDSLKKRWHEDWGVRHVSTRMLNTWDKEDYSDSEFYHTVREQKFNRYTATDSM